MQKFPLSKRGMAVTGGVLLLMLAVVSREPGQESYSYPHGPTATEPSFTPAQVSDVTTIASEAKRVATIDAGRPVATNDPLLQRASNIVRILDQHCTEPVPTLVNSAVAATATLKQAGFTRGPVQILEDTMVALPAYVTRVSCAHWIPDDVTLTEQGG